MNQIPQPADHARRIESLIRLGKIESVDTEAALVRVETGGLLTEWLPWFERRAGTTRDWDPPTPGEQCMVLSESGDPACGVVLVGIFSNANPAPRNTPDERHRIYPDGTTYTYNHAKHDLTLNVVGNVFVTTKGVTHLTAHGEVTVHTDASAEVRAKGDVKVTAEGNAEVRAKGWMQILASGRMLIKSLSALTLKGPSRTIHL